jgi:hypothetical protein
MTAAFYPCCSKDNCCGDALTSKATNQNSHKPEGTCSPFITCCTCTGFTQMTRPVVIPMFKESKPVHHSKGIFLTLTTYTASLLQPPRIA